MDEHSESGEPERHRDRRLAVWGMAGLLCLLFFAFTRPGDRPSVLLLAGFVVLALLLASIYNIMMILTGLDRRLPAQVQRIVRGGVILLPVLLIMLQSTGQLTVRDIVTLSALFGLGYFYVGRLRGPA